MTKEQLRIMTCIIHGGYIEYMYHPVLKLWLYILKNKAEFMLEILTKTFVNGLVRDELLRKENNLYVM